MVMDPLIISLLCKNVAKCSNIAIFRLDVFSLVLTFDVATAYLLACLQFVFGINTRIGGGLCVTK
jgi:hypothetical protein